MSSQLTASPFRPNKSPTSVAKRSSFSSPSRRRIWINRPRRTLFDPKTQPTRLIRLRLHRAQPLHLPIALGDLQDGVEADLRVSGAVLGGERVQLVDDGAEHGVAGDIDNLAGYSAVVDRDASRRVWGPERQVVGVDHGGRDPVAGLFVVGDAVGGPVPLAADGVGEGERGEEKDGEERTHGSVHGRGRMGYRIWGLRRIGQKTLEELMTFIRLPLSMVLVLTLVVFFTAYPARFVRTKIQHGRKVHTP